MWHFTPQKDKWYTDRDPCKHILQKNPVTKELLCFNSNSLQFKKKKKYELYSYHFWGIYTEINRNLARQ